MELSLSTRFAKTLGIETKRYKQAVAEQQQKILCASREEAFLYSPREKALRDFPELQPIFDVQDSALRFYHDVLIATPTSLNTNHRNTFRAQWAAREALTYLDKNQPIPKFTREGRHEEASSLKEDELRTLRRELTLSYEENARVNPALRHDAQSRYAQFSPLYFSDEKKALQQFPELSPLVNIKKQASRYFKDWVRPEDVESTIKDCLNRAIQDIARHLPVQNAEEIKADALALRSSLVGTGSTTPNTNKKHNYQPDIDLMRSLIGRNGLESGLWPYSMNLLETTDRIKTINHDITREQWMSAFNTQPKEQVLKIFPQLDVLYNKQDAARLFYSEKMASPFADMAATALLKPDFDKLIRGESLLAVSEIDLRAHEKIIQIIQHQQQIEGKDTSLILAAKPFATVIENVVRLQDSHYTETDASNDMTHDTIPYPSPAQNEPNMTHEAPTVKELLSQVQALKKQLTELTKVQIELDPIEAIQREVDALEAREVTATNDDSKISRIQVNKNTPTHSTSPSIRLDALRSTATPLPISHLFSSSHQSKLTKSEETGKHWDIQTMTAGLNKQCEAVVTSLMGDPIAREKNQLRFGSNKGSFILTTQGSKSGQWFDHQTGVGGNMLTLIQDQKGYTFKQALDFAGEFLNMTSDTRARDVIDISDLPSGIDEDKQRTVQYARKLANQSRPVKGTLAETYLEKTRGIDTRICSESIRFLPSIKEPETGEFHPALLVIAKNMEGNVQGVQAIFLSKEGEKLDCQNPKRSYGLIKGSAIPVHEGGNLYAVAEGAETALSIATACKDMTVFASLGSITNFSAMDFKTKSNTLIIFADHDHPGNESHNKVNNAADELKNKGFNVLLCTPDEVGTDFNDLLRAKGVEGVRQQMNQLVMHEQANAKQKKEPVNQGRKHEKKFKEEYELGV